jgi:hypothetical protein
LPKQARNLNFLQRFFLPREENRLKVMDFFRYSDSPTVENGVEGMALRPTAIKSARNGSGWTEVATTERL